MFPNDWISFWNVYGMITDPCLKDISFFFGMQIQMMGTYIRRDTWLARNKLPIPVNTDTWAPVEPFGWQATATSKNFIVDSYSDTDAPIVHAICIWPIHPKLWPKEGVHSFAVLSKWSYEFSMVAGFFAHILSMGKGINNKHWKQEHQF